MKIESGYIYHIKDSFFERINDKKLMINHENGHSRPTYFIIKDGSIFWFVPLSSKIEKYAAEIDKKEKKYGSCKTILIRKIADKNTAILLQNAFPITEKYIGHPHLMSDGSPLHVIESVEDEILNNFKYMLSMKKEGINLFFVDIDMIKKILEEELNTN